MSNEQSIRDELAEDIQAYLVMSGVYLDHEVSRSLADCLLDEDGPSVIRRMQAEALREAAHELWRVTKDCDEHCDDDWRYRLQSKADWIERGETA